MIENGIETVALKCVGGPAPGIRFVPITAVGGKWPLPDTLPLGTADGHYRKVSQSDLPDTAINHPNVARGAEYEWIAANTDSEKN